MSPSDPAFRWVAKTVRELVDRIALLEAKEKGLEHRPTFQWNPNAKEFVPRRVISIADAVCGRTGVLPHESFVDTYEDEDEDAVTNEHARMDQTLFEDKVSTSPSDDEYYSQGKQPIILDDMPEELPGASTERDNDFLLVEAATYSPDTTSELHEFEKRSDRGPRGVDEEDCVDIWQSFDLQEMILPVSGMSDGSFPLNLQRSLFFALPANADLIANIFSGICIGSAFRHSDEWMETPVEAPAEEQQKQVLQRRLQMMMMCAEKAGWPLPMVKLVSCAVKDTLVWLECWHSLDELRAKVDYLDDLMTKVANKADKCIGKHV